MLPSEDVVDRKEYWDRVHTSSEPADLTWFHELPAVPLSLIRGTGLHSGSRLIDVGVGPSLLSSFLLEEGLRHLSVLDIEVLGSEYRPRGSVGEAHRTPWGGTQASVYSWFQSGGGPGE